MDKLIDARFERLEKALSNLIDSVTKYHPSAAYAEELFAADTELSKGLEQVQEHQNNYLRIQELRKTSAALDAQIRETLSTLATTRKDIVTTQTTHFPPGPSFPIRYEELLSYARRISKTTMPPSATLNTMQPVSVAQTPVVESQPQSAVTPTAMTPSQSQTQSPAPLNGVLSQASEQPATQQTASTNITLPENMSQYLNPLSGQLFIPWPSEDSIRRGALASNQALVERGIDPKGYDPLAEEERKRKEEEDRKEREEKEKLEREERERKQREERERLRVERERQREKEQEEWRRSSVLDAQTGGPGTAATAPPPSEKKQFQFTNLDDLDDDDDD